MQEFLVETEEYKGHIIELYQDTDPESPREWDNLGKMVCFHRQYDLGDKHNFADGEELVNFVGARDVISLPLYLIDHSGISMNTGGYRHCDSQGWDWGQVGYIYATKEMIRKGFGVKHIRLNTLQRAIEILQQEVKTYDKYLTGNVLGYIIKDADGDVVDSCWGLYDNPTDECKGIVDSIVDKAKHFPKAEVFITKTHKFRARIRESVEEPSYEVTVGGEEWQNGKGVRHIKTIFSQMEHIISELKAEYGTLYIKNYDLILP